MLKCIALNIHNSKIADGHMCPLTIEIVNDNILIIINGNEYLNPD